MVHAAVCRPDVAPYLPAGQGEQSRAPANENVPAGHRPAQSAVLMPVVLPNRPAAHAVQFVAPNSEYVPKPQGPAQARDAMPVVLPKVPPAQSRHDTAPVVALYRPAEHATGVDVPVGHWEPTGHCPEQADVVNPVTLPYLGGGFTRWDKE